MPYHYPKLARAMRDYEYDFSKEEIKDADDDLFEINERYYMDKDLWEQGLNEEFTSLEAIEHRHEAELQDFFEDTFGEDAWDDRHEIYAHEE